MRARCCAARAHPGRARRKGADTPREGVPCRDRTALRRRRSSCRFRAFAERLAVIARDFPADDEARVFEALALLGTIPEGSEIPRHR